MVGRARGKIIRTSFFAWYRDRLPEEEKVNQEIRARMAKWQKRKKRRKTRKLLAHIIAVKRGRTSTQLLLRTTCLALVLIGRAMSLSSLVSISERKQVSLRFLHYHGLYNSFV